MALDHYVSQVHLRNFYSPALGEQMYAIRKSNLQTFPCSARDVCRIEEGSTDAYLIHDRAIEDFLLTVEPRYNASIAKLRNGTIDTECVHAIAGFVAYIGCCTPAAMRIHQEPLRAQLTSTAEILDRQGLIPKAPPSLGGKSLTELLAEGTVRHEIDPKFPQAIGISTVVGRTSIYGNSHWDIVLNGEDDSSFFTSDYPLALEEVHGNPIPNWIVPLAPDLAIRIVPDIRLSGKDPDLSFPGFNYRRRQATSQEIRDLNRLLVRCAEDMVFYRDDRHWIEPFVKKNRNFRVEGQTTKIPHGTGFLNVSTQKIVRLGT